MATCNNENRKTNCTSGLKAPVRNQYFYGKLLTVRDFENEQSYHIKKQRLLNKHIHGEGVVCGLTVEKVDPKKLEIKIKSGIALDCCGREIIVPNDEKIDLSGKVDDVYWITISYSECGKEPVAAAVEANSCEEECCFSRIEEGYKIEIVSTKPEVCPNVSLGCKGDSTDEEYVSQVQGQYSEKDEKPLILAKVTINDNAITIDNAIVNNNTFDKKLVYTNPKLYELLKCGGQEEEETPITVKKISWPHAENFKKDVFDDAVSNGLKIIFSGDIECFNTNQCDQRSHFNVFPEVFKMEVLFFPNNESPFLQEFAITGELSMSKHILTFKPHEKINNIISEYAGSAMQVKITLNSNFIKGKDSNKPIYCGMYNFIVKGHTTKLKSLNHTTTTGGKFESWFYVTSGDSELPVHPKLVAYDSTNKYLGDSAKELSQRLKEKGVPVVLKKLSELTEEDKITHEIIFLRGKNLSDDASTKPEYVKSRIEWDESNGDVEIVHRAGHEGNPVFIIGGKDNDAVKNAVKIYISRYSDPQ